MNELQNRPAGLGKTGEDERSWWRKGGDGEWREDGVGGADDNRRSSGAVCWTHGWRCTCNKRTVKNQPSLSLSKIKYQEQKQQRDEYVKKEVEKNNQTVRLPKRREAHDGNDEEVFRLFQGEIFLGREKPGTR